MKPLSVDAPLQLHFFDSMQRRYEAIRPMLLLGERTAAQRAEELHLHPDTMREWLRRFQHQGMLGLLPAQTAVVPPRRGKAVPVAVVEALAHLKTLYTGFGYRELARILWHLTHERIDDKTVKKLWRQLPGSVPGERAVPPYHSQPSQGRLEVIKRYAQGWTKRSICGFLQVSRPTVDRWIRRFEAEHLDGLLGHKPGPQAPRKVWFPLMVEVYHLQKVHPDAGEFRLWSLLAREDISVRTVGRVMALNRQVSNDIPHQRRHEATHPPHPHPYKATRPHQYWFLDGRMMDFALDGVRWWSLLLLEGYSRTIVAGAVAPVEASWAALMVLYTACRRYGVPEAVISDSGGAFTSNDFEAVCRRLDSVANFHLRRFGVCSLPIMQGGKRGRETMAVSFKGAHFPQEIILPCVRWYVAYPLSTRHVEELMLERGVHVDHSTVNRWVIRYSPQLAEAFHRRKRPVWISWRMDETYIKIKGQWYYLYRAVDKHGQTIDFLLTEQRDEPAAKRFLTKAIRRHGVPEKITIDGSAANEAAIKSYNEEHGTNIIIRKRKYLNNIVEQDHRAVKRVTRPMLGFKSFDAAQDTLVGIELMHMIKKRQMVVEAGEEGRTAAELFYALAA